MALALSALAVRNPTINKGRPQRDRSLHLCLETRIDPAHANIDAIQINEYEAEGTCGHTRSCQLAWICPSRVNRYRGDPAASSAMSAVTPKAQCSLRHVISRPLACPQMEAKTTVTVFTPRSASATRPRSARPPQVRAPWSASSPHPRPPRRNPSSSTPSLRPWRRDALPPTWPRRG